jgi:hypothetical protein
VAQTACSLLGASTGPLTRWPLGSWKIVPRTIRAMPAIPAETFHLPASWRALRCSPGRIPSSWHATCNCDPPAVLWCATRMCKIEQTPLVTSAFHVRNAATMRRARKDNSKTGPFYKGSAHFLLRSCLSASFCLPHIAARDGRSSLPAARTRLNRPVARHHVRLPWP